MSKKVTTEEFIIRSKLIHGEKYNYSKVNYVNNCTKICIICPVHGKFYQSPSNHMKGVKCPKCATFDRSSKRKMLVLNVPRICEGRIRTSEESS